MFASGAASPDARADARADSCPVTSAPSRIEYRPGGAIAAAPDEQVDASADRVTSEDGLVSLDGDATIDYLGRRISSDAASYRAATGEVEVDGAVQVEGPGIALSSDAATIDLDDDSFEMSTTRYRIDLPEQRASGTATRMSAEPGGQRFVLEDATYSTCPPEHLDWYVSAKRIRIDTGSGIGTATGIALRFKGVPIFALPAFSFPVGTQRKTGFLAPAIARGNKTGLEIFLPWYWNVRPNLDATFVPRLMTKRGLQLQTELRYLDGQGAWTLDNEILRDRDYGRWRSFTRLRQSGAFGPRVRTEIDAATVTDDRYFDDLGSSLQRASVTHLEQRAEIVFEDEWTTAVARLQAFETVDRSLRSPEERPYRRVPQLAMRSVSPVRPFGVQGSFDGELVFFDRRDSIRAARIDLRPRLSLPLGGDAWFVEPAVSHRLTYYGLTDSGPQGSSGSISRNLDTLSLDAGLFFDRIVDGAGTVQTLEPRLYYLRVPYLDQSRIPVFDSSAFDFNISQLFRENRYSGTDRVADADQLSLSLTTRIIDGVDGRESLRASVGQILFFQDRRVTLPDETLASGGELGTGERSDLVAEVATELKRDWLARGSIQWNPDRDETVRGSLQLGYRPDSGRIVNFAHRVVNTGTRADTEQIDLSALWPIGDEWRIAARWNYSLDAGVSIESLLGLEYDSCCWALRLAARRYIADDGEGHDTNLYLQLVLKGLAPVGQNYGAVLENAILGYRDEY